MNPTSGGEPGRPRARRPVLECPFCGDIFVNSASFREHYKSHYPGSPQHETSIAPELDVPSKLLVLLLSLPPELAAGMFAEISLQSGPRPAHRVIDRLEGLPELTAEQRLGVLEELWARLCCDQPQVVARWLGERAQSSPEARPERLLRLMFPDYADDIWRICDGVTEIEVTISELPERAPSIHTFESSRMGLLRRDFEQFLRLQTFLDNVELQSSLDDVVGQWIRERPDELARHLQRFLSLTKGSIQEKEKRWRLEVLRRVLGVSSDPPTFFFGLTPLFEAPLLLLSFLRFVTGSQLQADRFRIVDKISELLKTEELGESWLAMAESDSHWDMFSLLRMLHGTQELAPPDSSASGA